MFNVYYKFIVVEALHVFLVNFHLSISSECFSNQVVSVHVSISAGESC